MKKMFRSVAALVAMLCLSAVAMADVGGNVALGGAVAVVGQSSTSAVLGSNSTSLTGLGSLSNSFSSSNQAGAKAGVSFDTHTGVTYQQGTQYNNTGNGNNGVVNTQSADHTVNNGITFSNQTGAENDSSAIASSAGLLSSQSSNATGAGSATSTTLGGAAFGGLGIAGF